MKLSLPGIISIQYLECLLLPSQIEMKCLAGIPVGIFSNRTGIDFSGTPICVTESEYDNNSQREKTTLSFQTTDDLPVRRKLAFIVTDVLKRSFVIGHYESPFPTIKRTQHTGEPDGEKCGFFYEVTLIGRNALVPVSLG